MTCRAEVLKAAQALSGRSPTGEFTVDEVLRYMKQHKTTYRESTIRTHVTSRMCANAPDNHGTTYADLVRNSRGSYRLTRTRSLSHSRSSGASNIPRPKAANQPTHKNHDLDALSEDEIKTALKDWLEQDNWETNVAWGHTPGIDIEATRGSVRWVIEVKGPGSRPPMRVNYFLAILGETLQRMDDAQARYSIALPDLPQYRKLWDRLPQLAKSRTGISILFVSEDRKIQHLNPMS